VVLIHADAGHADVERGQIRLIGGVVARVFTGFRRSLEWRYAMTRKRFGCGLALVVLVIALGVFGLRPQTQAQQTGAQAAAGARYTVVDSDATNLIVVDNRSNTLYFYTENPGKEVGEELHLRGSIDLNEVGKSVLNPKSAK
jgi:hypothetical protein